MGSLKVTQSTEPPLKLPKRAFQLYDLLAGNGDVDIDALFAAMGGPAPSDPQYRQRWLGAYITDLNRRIAPHGQRVIPGQLKRTYCLAIDE